MSLILQYGNYSHPAGTVALAISKQAVLAGTGLPLMIQTTWGIEGTLLCDSSLTEAAEINADITSRIQALEDAYKQVGVDLVLTTENGTPTAHVIRNSETIGGIRVIEPPHYPYGSGAEYVTYRRFRVGLQADVLPSGGVQPVYLSFNETLTVQGGGPQYAWTTPILGSPTRQVIRQATTYTATQQGFAVGFRSTPPVPPPLFPGALMANPQVSYTSPQRRGNDFMQFGVSWQYVYESNQPLFGVPNAQPTL